MSVSDPTPPPVRPAVALAFAAIGFAALTIMGFGLASLGTGEEVITAPGLGQLPGILGMLFAVAAFVAVLWGVLRRPHPSFLAVFALVPIVFVAYLFGILAGAVVSATDAAPALAAAGSVATSWTGVILAGTAAVSGWAGIALVRTKASRPKWQWEDAEDDE